MTPLDRLLAALEPYAEGRVVERDLRRQMLGLRCTAAEDVTARCYLASEDQGAYCPSCRARSELWKLFKSRRKANKALLRRVEALALRLSIPEGPEIPEEPKRLLELMT